MSENIFNKKSILIFGIGFIVNYILLYVLSAFQIINNINKPWSNHLFVIAFFFFGFYVFSVLKTKMKFNFAEIYVGAILLILLYFSFFLAYLIYYSQLSGVFSYLINCPYIHIAVSFFFGWLAFFFANYSEKN